MKNPIFMGGGFTKKPYRGEGLPKRWGGGGLGEFVNLRGRGLARKTEVVASFFLEVGS